MRSGWMVLVLLLVPAAMAQVKVSHFPAHDTLNIAPDSDAQAQETLDGLAWTPQAFEVRAEALDNGERDAVVSFASPRPQDEARQNRVPMEWFAARDDSGQVVEGRALLVVHSLHPAMPFARVVARELSRRGTHVFVLHLPGYGLRDSGRLSAPLSALLHPRQSVADVRRARDAIAALPNVQPGAIGLVGISMGGFAAATAASLDGAFEPVMLLLSGADGYKVLREGQHDAARVRQLLARHGYTDDRLRQLLDLADPQYLVHRLNPRRTWLFSARDDQVIPAGSVNALTDRLPLPPDHHRWILGTHYTAVLALPWIIDQMGVILETGS